MQTLTPHETTTMHHVGNLMVRTLALAAHNRAAVKIGSTETPSNPRHLRLDVMADPADAPLILGGKGTNTKTVRELAAMACPSGAFIDLHLLTPDAPAERAQRNFGDAKILELSLTLEISDVIADWHKALGDDAPQIDFQHTSRCDIWLVQSRNIPGNAMGHLRRVIGWACKVRGRNGFVEWESQR